MKYFLALLISLLSFSGHTQSVRNVDAITFQELINGKKYILLDLRTDDEIIRKGFIKGAKQIDFFSKDAEKKIMELDKKQPYLIYCAGGGRSTECAEMMQKLNFSEVINLEKGFDDWSRKGFGIEKK